MDMTCENRHSIYLPINNWVYILHTHLSKHLPTHTHIYKTYHIHTCLHKIWTEYFYPRLQTQMVLKKCPDGEFYVQEVWNQTSVENLNSCLFFCFNAFNILCNCWLFFYLTFSVSQFSCVCVQVKLNWILTVTFLMGPPDLSPDHMFNYILQSSPPPHPSLWRDSLESTIFNQLIELRE